MRHRRLGRGTAWGRRLVLIGTTFVLAGAASTAGRSAPLGGAPIDTALLSAAAANPFSTQKVIVQASGVQAATAAVAAVGGTIRRPLAIIDSVAANVPATA